MVLRWFTWAKNYMMVRLALEIGRPTYILSQSPTAYGLEDNNRMEDKANIFLFLLENNTKAHPKDEEMHPNCSFPYYWRFNWKQKLETYGSKYEAQVVSIFRIVKKQFDFKGKISYFRKQIK